MPGGVEEALLRHPNGSLVVVIGTQHVSATHGCAAQEAVARWGQPPTVVLEIDQDRFRELNLRLVHLIHHDTASLLELAAQPATAADGPLSAACMHLLPDALLWQQHQQQFQTVRNEGVPLLLGSLYGSDMLQAALAATPPTTAAQAQQQPCNSSTSHAGPTNRTPSSSSSIVLADQPQEITMARFRALSSGLALQQLGLWLGSVVPGSIAHAEATLAPVDAAAAGVQAYAGSSSSSGAAGVCALASDRQQQQQPPVLLAAAQTAVGRLLHLCVQWWSMALSSRADWYGHNVHPVFLLVNNVQLQQQLQDKGVVGVQMAAGAAARLLQAATAGVSPTAADLSAVRTFAASLEHVQRSLSTGSSSSSSSSSSVRTGGGSSSSGSSSDEFALLTRPWWVSLSEKLSGNFTPAGMNVPPHQRQRQQHVNHTAAMAYEQAVMADRNAVLADALWNQAEAADVSVKHPGCLSGDTTSSSSWVAGLWGSSSSRTIAAAAAAATQPAVLGVVGRNHLPGIVQEWKQRELQWHSQQQHVDASTGNLGPSVWKQQQQHYQDHGSSNLGPLGCWQQQQQHYQDHCSSDLGLPQQQYAALRLATTDAAADALEFFAAGSAGLAYICAVSRMTQPEHYEAPTAAAAAASGTPATAATAGVGLNATLSRGSLRALNVAWSLAHPTSSMSSSSSSSSSSSAAFQRPGHTEWQQQQQQQSMGQLYNKLTWRMPPVHHMKRIGLLLLPVGIALLPLQRDAGRHQEASKLLHNVALVNDEMTQQGQYGAGMESILRLAGVLPA